MNTTISFFIPSANTTSTSRDVFVSNKNGPDGPFLLAGGFTLMRIDHGSRFNVFDASNFPPMSVKAVYFCGVENCRVTSQVD